MDRIRQLQEFIAANPKDPFPRYGLALALKGDGRLEESRAQFAELLNGFPDYVPAYLHAGGVLVALGQTEAAAETYRRGMDVSTHKRDFHAKSELEAALAQLENPED